MLNEQKNRGFCTCYFCGGCLHFDLSRAGEMVNCPQCGMETVLHLPDQRPPYQPDRFALRVKRFEWETCPSGVRYLVGEMVNQSSYELDWTKIEFILYGSGDAPVGMASDSLKRFQPGETWKFRAPVFQKTAVRAALRTVCCEFGKCPQTGFTTINLAPDSAQDPVPAKDEPALCFA